MKLIDLLVKELPRRGGWPANISYIAQDEGSATWGFRYKPERDSDGEWMDTSESGYEMKIDRIGAADDCNTSVVSRKQYEAALAASKAVVGHDGWIEWHGGECPVDSDAIVEVKFRNPSRNKFNNDRAGDFTWSHDGFDGDIIAYRLQQPMKSEQACDDTAGDDDESDLNECIGQDVDMPEWNGEGLPPVGTVCMANLANGWTDVKVAYIGDEGGCREALVFEIESTKPAWADEFRPLRTEAEKARDKLAASLHIAAGASPIELNGIGPLYFKLSDAIISGSVFGTTFKAGK